MTSEDITVLREYLKELDFIASKLEDKVAEIGQEIEKIHLVQKCISSELDANPEFEFVT